MGTGENTKETNNVSRVKDAFFDFLVREHMVKDKDYSNTLLENRKVYFLENQWTWLFYKEWEGL